MKATKVFTGSASTRITLAVLLSIGAGCSGTTAPTGQSAPASQVASDIRTAIDLLTDLPLAGYMRRAARVYTATDRLMREEIRTCMRSKGFEYLDPPVVGPAPEDFRGYLSRYGALTLEGQSGVYLPGGADSDSAEANDPMEAEAPSRAYLLALHGHESAPSAPVVDKSGATVGLYSEPGGCVAAAIERLYGSTERYRTMFSTLRTADQYVADAFAATMVMANSSPLTGAWSDCLYQSTGIRWRDPWAGYEFDWSALSASAQKNVFQNDIACKWSTGLAQEMFRADYDSQEEALTKNPTLLGDLNEVIRDLTLGGS